MNKLSSIHTFIIFCLEAYKIENKITGQNALNDFEKYNIFNFLESAYDVLHTQSMKFIVDEINEFIKNER